MTSQKFPDSREARCSEPRRRGSATARSASSRHAGGTNSRPSPRPQTHLRNLSVNVRAGNAEGLLRKQMNKANCGNNAQHNSCGGRRRRDTILKPLETYTPPRRPLNRRSEISPKAFENSSTEPLRSHVRAPTAPTCEIRPQSPSSAKFAPMLANIARNTHNAEVGTTWVHIGPNSAESDLAQCGQDWPTSVRAWSTSHKPGQSRPS